MTDYSYTISNASAALEHVRVIDRGGFGEVHEIRSKTDSSSFARKLLRPFGQTTKEDIENEVKAVTKICATDGNENIIRILGHSPLPSTDYYYIDMELCDVNLAAYINPSYDRKLLVPTKELQNAKSPVVVTVPRGISEPYRVSTENTYTIMSHIVSGLEFLHSHRLAHRDLKPQNVLYSLKENKWKLVDFGITSQATTDQANPTVYARGTGGYRAPELLTVPAAFTNKVDIWALGCIFYELLTEGEKAFQDDFSVQTYRMSTSKCPKIPRRMFITRFRITLRDSDNLLFSQMVARQPGERPNITLLQNVFQTRCTVASSLVWEAAYDVSSWLWDPVSLNGLSRRELLSWIATALEGDDPNEHGISLLKTLVSEVPANDDYRKRLRDLGVKRGQLLNLLGFWEQLVGKHPHNRKFFNELRAIADQYFGTTNDSALAKRITLFTRKNRNNQRLFFLYSEIFARITGEKGAWDISAKLLGALVAKRPHNSDLQKKLNVACQNAYKDPYQRSAVWANLVAIHPTEETLIAQLHQALEECEDESKVVRLWVTLVTEHPQVTLLRNQLRQTLYDMCDDDYAVGVWKGLVGKFQENTELEEELNVAIEARDIGYNTIVQEVQDLSGRRGA